jgi:hypothetical protein
MHNDMKRIINCASMQISFSAYFLFLCNVISVVDSFYINRFLSAVNEHKAKFSSPQNSIPLKNFLLFFYCY